MIESKIFINEEGQADTVYLVEINESVEKQMNLNNSFSDSSSNAPWYRLSPPNLNSINKDLTLKRKKSVNYVVEMP